MTDSETTNRRIDKLIDLLIANATVVVSGGKVARDIRVTRSTVWRWVQRLRGMGVEIQGHIGAGYQLKKIPDILFPSQIRRNFRGEQIGHRVLHYFSVGSTNDVAMRQAGRGAAHGTVVVAEAQTAGRGRFGRTWYSEKSSGLYLSVILRPALSPAAAPLLPLLTGVAAQDAIESVTKLRPDIRWPNDLLVGKKKICGILTEMSAELDRLHYVVLGIGINVNHRRIPNPLSAIATSLRLECGKEFSRVTLLVALLRSLERYYRLFLAKGAGPIVERYRAGSSYAGGKRIRIKTPTEEFTATTVDLEPSGALRIRRKGGREESLLSGEIVELK